MRSKFFLPLLLLLALFVATLSQPTVQAAPDGIINVTTTQDEFDKTGTGLGCSLREAIQAANLDKAFGGCNAGSGADTIQLPPGTYMIERAGADDKNKTGDFDVKKDLTIQGNSANNTILNGNALDRVIQARANLTLSAVTITGGRVADGGAGILAAKNLTILDSRITNNETDDAGGGILNATDGNFTLRIVNTLIQDNHAYAGGGGIYTNVPVIIENSTLDLNSVAGIPFVSGGGLYSSNHLTIRNSTISYNSAVVGGGIYTQGNGVIVNSTIAGNTAIIDGGGIRNDDTATLKIYSSTIAYNKADSDSNNTGVGGGIHNPSCAGNCNVVELYNTIVGANTRRASGPALDDTSGYFVLGGYNLIQAPGGQYVGDTTHFLAGFNPGLSGLSGNGGSTYTISLQSDSVALDAGNPNGCRDENNKILTADQRGQTRVMDGRGLYGPLCDIGAYEAPLASTCTNKPSKPTLVKPDDTATIGKTRVKLDWGLTACAVTYSVIVKQGAKNGPTADAQAGLYFSKYKTTALASPETFFWRVKACNPNGCSKSAWRSFNR